MSAGDNCPQADTPVTGTGTGRRLLNHKNLLDKQIQNTSHTSHQQTHQSPAPELDADLAVAKAMLVQDDQVLLRREYRRQESGSSSHGSRRRDATTASVS